MENEKFQEVVIEQLSEVILKLDQHDKPFDILEERICKVEDIHKKHHEDSENIALEVEQLISDQDDLVNYFIQKRAKV